mgnify:CR=1 FL=1
MNHDPRQNPSGLNAQTPCREKLVVMNIRTYPGKLHLAGRHTESKDLHPVRFPQVDMMFSGFLFPDRNTGHVKTILLKCFVHLFTHFKRSQ